MSERKPGDLLPSGWRTLDSDARDSTVAWFTGGYKSSKELEVLVWQGVEGESGEMVIETSHDDYIPGIHTHIIEMKLGDEVVYQMFAEDAPDAWSIANGVVVGFYLGDGGMYHEWGKEKGHIPEEQYNE